MFNNYFVRRLLLVIPTFLGITVMVFVITRFVPGGPVERAIMNYYAMQSGAGQEAGGSASSTRGPDNQMDSQGLPDDVVKDLQAYYGFDKPPLIAYFDWLFKVLKGDFGRSSRYTDPVLGMIVSKFPISLRFGITSVLLIYLISIPLGIKKALSHGKAFDNVSSGLIFFGYALPGYIVAILLLTFFSFRLNVLPSGGLYSAGYEKFTFFEKIVDNIKHWILPITAYVIGGFASLTITMKNNLMENMAADYIKTAVAKGCTFKDAMWKHAFRNSIIPIASGLGSLITIFFSGSFLIEKIFNINGMGLLGFSAIEQRDYPVVMGVLAITALVSLIANILSDLILSLVDPRIRLGK